ncbi:MAG: tetratricopeptide repeat protein, partial [Bacteroidota bacterium]
RLDEALIVYEHVIERFPQSGEARLGAAQACLELGRLVDAIQHYEQALVQRPAHAPAFYALVETLIAHDQLDLAVDAFVRYHERVPSSPEREALQRRLASTTQHQLDVWTDAVDVASSGQRRTSVPQVLCYAPYNMWRLHGLWELTILHALRLRGAEVRHVLCNALYAECDLFWAATRPRHRLSCAECQASVTRLFWEMQAPYEWLGQHLQPSDYAEARTWAASVPTHRLLDATYQDWTLGAWIKSSVHTHLRRNVLVVEDEQTEMIIRRYLYSGWVAAQGLERLLDQAAPDVLFLFNGRMSSTRIALELARRRGIRVVTHERGWLNESLRLAVNVQVNSLKPRKALWQAWGGVPLATAELERVQGYLNDRAQGRNTNWTAFNAPSQAADEVRAALGLQEGRPLWVLFTSSEDERIGSDEIVGAFPSQQAWVQAAVEFAASQPGLDLVIRAHPNIAGTRANGTNQEQLAQLEALRDQLPPTVRLIMPQDAVDSYALMHAATVGLVYNSTVGLEMACQGAHVIEASTSLVSDLPFVRTVHSPVQFGHALREALRLPPRARRPEVQQQAMRFAYALFFRENVPFPLVRMITPREGELAYTALSALEPGQDPHLDRVARILLDQAPVCRPPSPEEQARTEADEQRWLATLYPRNA